MTGGKDEKYSVRVQGPLKPCRPCIVWGVKATSERGRCAVGESVTRHAVLTLELLRIQHCYNTVSRSTCVGGDSVPRLAALCHGGATRLTPLCHGGAALEKKRVEQRSNDGPVSPLSTPNTSGGWRVSWLRRWGEDDGRIQVSGTMK